MRQHESLLASQGLPPMDPSARSQFRAARIGHAVALLPPYPLPLPLLHNSSLLLDALSFVLLRALLAFALICNELLCCFM